MQKLILSLPLLLLCVSANAQKFSVPVAKTDAIRSGVRKVIPNRVISPDVLFPGDYNKQADFMMKLVTASYRPATKSARLHSDMAVFAIKGLGMLGTGRDPVVTDQKLLFWIPREIINAMHYSESEEVRGFAAITLGMVAQGKDDRYNKEIIDALSRLIVNSGYKYELRRAAILGLGSISTQQSVSAVTRILQGFAKSHDFIGRQKVKDEDDQSVFGLEVALVNALGSKLEAGNPTFAQAENALRYFGAVSGRYCGDRTHVVFPNYTDKTTVVAARMALAKANRLYSSFSKTMQPNGKFISTQNGTVTCLLPIANEGSLPCHIVKGASKEFWRINGAMLSDGKSYLPGGGDCTEHIVNTLIYEYTKAYVMGWGINAILKGLSTAVYTGIETIGGMRAAARLRLYSRMLKAQLATPNKGYSAYKELMKPYGHYKKFQKAFD